MRLEGENRRKLYAPLSLLSMGLLFVVLAQFSFFLFLGANKVWHYQLKKMKGAVGEGKLEIRRALFAVHFA